MSWNHSPSHSSMPHGWSFHPPEGPRYGPPCSTHSLQRGKGTMSFKWRSSWIIIWSWYNSLTAKQNIVTLRCQLHWYLFVLGSLGLYLRFHIFDLRKKSMTKQVETMRPWKKTTWNCKESQHITCWKPKGPRNIFPVDFWKAIHLNAAFAG